MNSSDLAGGMESLITHHTVSPILINTHQKEGKALKIHKMNETETDPDKWKISSYFPLKWF